MTNDPSTFSGFQEDVDRLLLRNRSVLDLLSKYQEGCARTNRAVVKAATQCGCIRISGEKQAIPPGATLAKLRGCLSTQAAGELCPTCADIVEKELGRSLFYMTALINALGLDAQSVLDSERERLLAFGQYNLR